MSAQKGRYLRSAIPAKFVYDESVRQVVPGGNALPPDRLSFCEHSRIY